MWTEVLSGIGFIKRKSSPVECKQNFSAKLWNENIVTDLELKKKRVEIVRSGNIYYYALYYYALFVFSLAKSSINESFASL